MRHGLQITVVVFGVLLKPETGWSLLGYRKSFMETETLRHKTLRRAMGLLTTDHQMGQQTLHRVLKTSDEAYRRDMLGNDTKEEDGMGDIFIGGDVTENGVKQMAKMVRKPSIIPSLAKAAGMIALGGSGLGAAYLIGEAIKNRPVVPSVDTDTSAEISLPDPAEYK
jgi:hypothetical protein